MKVRIIANPIAGGGLGKTRAEELERALKMRGAVVETCITQQAGDAKDLAGKSGVDRIAVIGGDGTLNEVVNGLIDMDVPIAILPVGSANVVARELKMPPDAAVVAERIVSGQFRPMDVALAGGRRFLLGAGGGLDAAIATMVKRTRGKKSSMRQWVWPTIYTALTYRYPLVRVIVDGKVVSEGTKYVVVGNCRYSAGFFPATRRAKIDDGLLDVILAKKLGPFRTLSFALMIWFSSFPDRHDITYVQGANVTLEAVSDESVPLQIDGDPAGSTPASFSVLPRAIRVVSGP